MNDAFGAFVWSILVQQPSILVGLLPEKTTSEVYVAPQTSAKRKARGKGDIDDNRFVPNLSVLSEGKLMPLGNLKHLYGAALRIAVDPSVCFATVTGLHVRVRCWYSAYFLIPL